MINGNMKGKVHDKKLKLKVLKILIKYKKNS